MTDSDIGQTIRSIRKSKNMTIKQLAKATGFSEQAISQYELCKRSIKIETLKKIAKGLDTDVSVLLERSRVDEDGTLHDTPFDEEAEKRYISLYNDYGLLADAEEAIQQKTEGLTREAKEAFISGYKMAVLEDRGMIPNKQTLQKLGFSQDVIEIIIMIQSRSLDEKKKLFKILKDNKET